MAEPKIVSNLPIDVSIQWTKDQKLIEETRPIIAESDTISQFTQKDVTTPSIFSQVNLLLEIRLPPSWASFVPPKGYFDQRRRLFTSRIAPLFDTEEQLDDKIQKVRAVSDEEKQHQETLILMLEKLMELNRDLTFVLTRRNQYQRG